MAAQNCLSHNQSKLSDPALGSLQDYIVLSGKWRHLLRRPVIPLEAFYEEAESLFAIQHSSVDSVKLDSGRCPKKPTVLKEFYSVVLRRSWPRSSQQLDRTTHMLTAPKGAVNVIFFTSRPFQSRNEHSTTCMCKTNSASSSMMPTTSSRACCAQVVLVRYLHCMICWPSSINSARFFQALSVLTVLRIFRGSFYQPQESCTCYSVPLLKYAE